MDVKGVSIHRSGKHSSSSSNSTHTVTGGELTPLKKVQRTSEFWVRATSVYAGYKASQIRSTLLKNVLGWSEERVEEEVWAKQHEKAAEQMYSICVDMRGFYLKGGQFLGARSDFIPIQICKKLSLLQDKVPPMPKEQARAAIEAELGTPLENVFEWIDLDEPLGSASISQVHKARLRLPKGIKPKPRLWQRVWSWVRRKDYDQQERTRGYGKDGSGEISEMLLYNSSNINTCFGPHKSYVPSEVAHYAPPDGTVAVKIQYPNSLPTMTMDLQSLRIWAAFLSKTEIKFDMLSAVDELAKQIKLEFDFSREARIMNAVAKQFDGLGHRILVPRSIPSLVTPRLLVMDFIDGIPITKMKDQVEFQNLPAAAKRMAARHILSKVSEAYGRMILLDGLFQADGHPGNILVMKGGKIGLIDYGQSKKLPDRYRLPFAKMILALEQKDNTRICKAMEELNIETSEGDEAVKARIAWGMFDTEGTVNPFDPNSPIKQVSVENFPSDLFFVLRVSQLLRGLSNGMNIRDFSAAKQWSSFAQTAIRDLEDYDTSSRTDSHNKDTSIEDYICMLPIDGYFEVPELPS